jgi:malonate-semialdehyde dehydrogenase (acetylating)/methylmalonate-semialdehyde dehydrogenase
MSTQLLNYINGEWSRSSASESLSIVNPATAEVIATMPLSPVAEIDATVQAASAALKEWRQTPAGERVQYLFKFKSLLEDNLDSLARTVTNECGKTYAEAAGEIRRGIENVEVACGIPMLLQGAFSEDIARGIDEIMIRQPVGVVAAITPFNFPGMIPLWFLPYALACGNTFVLKPSDKTPMTAQKLVGLITQTGLPKGVVNLVNGTKETVDALIDHPTVRAISFVGSTPVAKYVYARAAANGKRAQCQGGAKNPLVVLPDADMEQVTRLAAESAFGCAGQRCLASSLAITIGESHSTFVAAMTEEARSRKVGYGLNEGVEMGPVIRPESKMRIEQLIQQGMEEGAKLIVDGRAVQIRGYESGYFLKPTILDGVAPDSQIAQTEIFGPVLGLLHAKDIDEAIALMNHHHYGNMACLFTRSGAAARKFRYEAQVGNIGINVGVAAPMAFFPFSGWKDSFFGDLHGQGRDAVDFYTEKKVVVERWW